MKKFIAIGIFALLSTGASAQTTEPRAAPYQTPPSGTVMPGETTTPPIPGANSFTEEQAKSRIEKMGYTNVMDLKKDEKGIWRGTGMKDGLKVSISLDYQGNVIAK